MAERAQVLRLQPAGEQRPRGRARQRSSEGGDEEGGGEAQPEGSRPVVEHRRVEEGPERPGDENGDSGEVRGSSEASPLHASRGAAEVREQSGERGGEIGKRESPEQERQRVGRAAGGSPEAALLRDNRGPGLIHRDQPRGGRIGLRELPIGPARPDRRERALHFFSRAATQAPIGEPLEHGEVEIEVRRGRGLGGHRAAAALERRQGERQEEQAGERRRACREPAQQAGSSPARVRGPGKGVEPVDQQAAVAFHQRASNPGPTAPMQRPCSSRAQASCCSSAARKTSSSWQWPAQAAASSVQETRSSERRPDPRICASH